MSFVFHCCYLIVVFYGVSAKIIKSKKFSGYRRLIFELAQQFKGCYHPHHPDESIWYPNDTDDLHISLVFKTEDNAIGFLGQLSYYKTYSKFRSGIEFEREAIPLSCLSEVTTNHVYIEDYKSEDSASPANSRDDTVCSSEVTSNDNDTMKGLRSLEDLSQLAYGEMINRCHIAASTPYPEYRRDSDNIIYASHLFHDLFDGDGKRPSSGANVDWGVPPKLLLEFLEATDRPDFNNGEKIFRITVRVIFRDPEIAKSMDGRWRDGCEIESELVVRSYFYTQNVEKTKKFLSIKHFETSRRWRHCDGEEVDFTEVWADV
jgi:hypothetical protein